MALHVESGKTTVPVAHAHSPTRRGTSPAEVTASKPTSTSVEQAFGMVMSESVVEVFSGVLGKIGGQALLDAVRKDTSVEIKDFLEDADLLDHALMAHMGWAGKVLERKILKRLARKTAAGTPAVETDYVNFASEVEKVRKQFLKRKQAASHQQTLE